MAELKIGLAPNRNSYFDPNTNTYLTLSKPIEKVTYNELDMPASVKRLERIVNALFASVPALVLYEGNVPQECIDAWKAKYMKPFNSLTSRNVVVSQAVVAGNMPLATSMLQQQVVGTVPVTDPLRNNIDYTGREIDPNRAFDRPAKVNNASADVVTAGTEQVELISDDDLQQPPVDSKKDEQVELLSLDQADQDQAGQEETAEKKVTGKKAKNEK